MIRMESNFALRTLALSAYVVGTCFIAFAIARGIERLVDLFVPTLVTDDLRTTKLVSTHSFTYKFYQGFAVNFVVVAVDPFSAEAVRCRYSDATLSIEGHRYEKSQAHHPLQNAQASRRRKRRRRN
jgi:hypothetical protein